MDANAFIAQFKSEASSDLVKVNHEYAAISRKLSAKDRGPFALNLLCVLCRNLDKVALWKDNIDPKALLTLSIDCVRETRVLDHNDRVKTLACVYHIHRHAVRQNKPVPPELVLKISFMPFELESKHLLKDYHKTYWNILADRLTYIERLKTKTNILKLLPKLTEDTLKVIDIYETTQFCSIVLMYLIKKLHLLYNEHGKELSQVYVQIFTRLSTKDLTAFKKLAERDTLDIYVKLSECLNVIAENASKVHFKGANLDVIVRSCISVVGHQPDLFHCLQTFYLNGFCCLFTDSTFTESILNGLLISCETTEKLGYGKAMVATYPYINQFLRLLIEYNVNNTATWKNNFDVPVQEKCLKLIQFLMQRLEKCGQMIKCENCSVRTGLHDSLRLSYQIKHFIMTSIAQKLQITPILPIFYEIVEKQYETISKLKDLKCKHYDKYFRKLQTDIHNTAIVLNKAEYFDYSIKLFDIFLLNELSYTTQEKSKDYKNITRAFYNKSICELDCKLYDKAIIDAFLSLIFAENLNSEKYMSLVMDIKAKELKSREDDVESGFQTITVLDACQKVIENKLYGDLEWFISKLKFSELLKHEFKMYAKLWPSIAPVGGVWNSLLELYKGRQDNWIQDEFPDTILESLHEIVLQTPAVVRTIHSEHFTSAVKHLLDDYVNTDGEERTLEHKLVQAALLCLQFDFDIKAASDKYQWKSTGPITSTDIDQLVSQRSVVVEHAATSGATVALLLTDLLPTLAANTKYLQRVVQIYEMSACHLLHLHRTAEGLQLAYICCAIADIVLDDETYLRNAGLLLRYLTKSDALDEIIAKAGQKMRKLDNGSETVVIFLCEAAMYYERIGEKGTSARIVQKVQNVILKAHQQKPDINLSMSLGRLLEAQARLCGPALPAVNNVLRHYLAMPTSGSNYLSRHTRSLASAALMCAGWRRLLRRAALAAYLRRGAAVDVVLAYCVTVDTDSFLDSQVKIDNRLKHMLGLQPNDIQTNTQTDQKQTHFIPKDVETMVDHMSFKNPTSPTPCGVIPAFKIPDFFTHKRNCKCYACEIPIVLILTCKIIYLEASMYFRSKEMSVARNYFDGVLKMLDLVEKKLKFVGNFEKFITDSIENSLKDEFNNVQIEIYIELTYFEMCCKNFNMADEYIVKIHEIMQQSVKIDEYLKNDVMNLLIASDNIKCLKKPKVTGLEAEFDNLKLSPIIEAPKTPESKPIMTKIEKIVVKDEEILKKRKVIKLNLDDDKDEENFEKKTTTRKFKVPNPITAKPLLEEATPKTGRIPKILYTQASVDSPKTDQRSSRSGQSTTRSSQSTSKSSQSTSKSSQSTLKSGQSTSKIPMTPTLDQNVSKVDKCDFKTPLESPEQFFTPMTSIKTYTKLRSNIVKNLEQEFSTPKINKENVLSVRKDKKVLKRVTSPGKLREMERNDVKETSRPRRLRQQVKLSLDED